MKLHFTGIFKLFKQGDSFFLINEKLDTIIPIDKSLYDILKKLDTGENIEIDGIKNETLNVLLYNRVLEVIS